MVSAYGYTDVAGLELFSSEDYGLIDPTYLTDPHVDAKITSAERKINTYTGTSFSGTIPDGIIDTTNVIAHRMILKWLSRHKFELSKEQLKEAAKPLLSDDVTLILNKYKQTEISPISLHRMYNNNPNVSY